MATSPRPLVSDTAAVRPVQLDQVEHLLKLQKWAQKITSILDLDELITKIVDDVAAAFCCVEATIYLHDEERGELEMAGVHGCTLHGKGSRLESGQGRHGGLRCVHRADALRARCAEGPLLHCLRGSRALRSGHSSAGGRPAGGRFRGFASRTGCLYARASAMVAGTVRTRGGRGAQRAPLSA